MRAKLGTAEKVHAWAGMLICVLLLFTGDLFPNAVGRWVNSIPYAEKAVVLALFAWFMSGYFIPSIRPSMPTFDGIKQRWVQVTIVLLIIAAVLVNWLANHGYFGAPPT
jgi:TRAP-type C4-dicarboxylate transport system permease small subunit